MDNTNSYVTHSSKAPLQAPYGDREVLTEPGIEHIQNAHGYLDVRPEGYFSSENYDISQTGSQLPSHTEDYPTPFTYQWIQNQTCPQWTQWSDSGYPTFAPSYIVSNDQVCTNTNLDDDDDDDDDDDNENVTEDPNYLPKEAVQFNQPSEPFAVAGHGFKFDYSRSSYNPMYDSASNPPIRPNNIPWNSSDSSIQLTSSSYSVTNQSQHTGGSSSPKNSRDSLFGNYGEEELNSASLRQEQKPDLTEPFCTEYRNDTDPNESGFVNSNTGRMDSNFANNSYDNMDEPNYLTTENALGLSTGAYFWQYNSQCKGPKASPLANLRSTNPQSDTPNTYQNDLAKCMTDNRQQNGDFISSSTSSQSNGLCPISMNSLPGYPLVVFEDPVQRRFDLVHCSKLRRGDGNDVTPNSIKLRSMGEELRLLTLNICAQSEVISTGLSGSSALIDCPEDDTYPMKLMRHPTDSQVVEQAKREKNKLASKICRLKKKAFHEANKIKYTGLEVEYNELAKVMVAVREMIISRLYQNQLRHSTNLLTSCPPNSNNELESLLKSNDTISNVTNWEIESQNTLTEWSPNCPNNQQMVSQSLYSRALTLYQNTHVTRTAGRTDMFVDEVIQKSSSEPTYHSDNKMPNGKINTTDTFHHPNHPNNLRLQQHVPCPPTHMEPFASRSANHVSYSDSISECNSNSFETILNSEWSQPGEICVQPPPKFVVVYPPTSAHP